MNPKKPDRRTARTRRCLQDALMKLIMEKGYDLVTIEEITGRADVGRTTFYLHFKDKEDLLLQSLEGLAQDLVARIGQDSEGGLTSQPLGEIILAVFEHAKENASMYLIVLKGGAALAALDRLNAYMVQVGTAIITMRVQNLGKRLSFPVEQAAAYFAASLLGYVTWWLRRGTPEAPAEIASVYTRLALNGILAAIEDQPPA